jgi:class 3 adenylate cyclase/Tfp pilus assembly protein PilF
MNQLEQQVADLRAALDRETDIKKRIELLNSIAFLYRFANTPEAIRTAHESLALAEEIDDEVGMAGAHLSLGFGYYMLSNYDVALKHQVRAQFLSDKLGDSIGAARARMAMAGLHWSTGNFDLALTNAFAGIKVLEIEQDEFTGWGWNIMGGIHQSMGDIDQSVVYFDKSLKAFEKVGSVIGQARVMNGLAVALEMMGNFEESLEYSVKSLAMHKQDGNVLGEARALNDMGSVYFKMGEFAQARDCHEKSLALRRSVKNRSSEITSLLNLGIVFTAAQEFETAHTYLQTALEYAEEIGAKPKLYEIHHALSTSFEQAGQFDKAFEHFKKYHTLKEEVLSNETATRLRSLQTSAATEKAERDAEIERLKNKELAEANAEIHRQMEILDEQASSIEIANAVLEERNITIAEMHQESERLLLNVLPKPIATRLKQGEKTIADSFDDVTVLFADIVGFTQLSARTSPQELVEMLDAIFSDFDALAEKYELEKIKTIGDCYMVVGGIPTPRPDHALAVSKMALEMRDSVRRLSDATNAQLAIRIGIHMGAVVAGVIGKKKFAYDLWGDTVNTASRMESHGEPGRVHISDVVYSLLTQKFASELERFHLTFEQRPQMQIKGKGLMNTWFLQD